MIPCICINDKDQKIPEHSKVKQGEHYHITHVYKMLNTGSILGCDIYEKQMGKECLPYEHWRLNIFAIKREDIENMLKLAKDCGELNDIDMTEIREMQHGELQES